MAPPSRAPATKTEGAEDNRRREQRGGLGSVHEHEAPAADDQVALVLAEGVAQSCDARLLGRVVGEPVVRDQLAACRR